MPSVGGIPFARSIEPISGGDGPTPPSGDMKHEITLTSEAFGIGEELQNAGDGNGSIDEVIKCQWSARFDAFPIGSTCNVYVSFVGRQDNPASGGVLTHCKAALYLATTPDVLGTLITGPIVFASDGTNDVYTMDAGIITTPASAGLIQFTLISGSASLGELNTSLVANAKSVTVRIVEV